MAVFAVAHKIDKYPAFHWWVTYTLRKRDTIVSAVNARVKRFTQKYGIEVLRRVKEAPDFDDHNLNHLWRDTLGKEISNLQVAFDILDENQHPPTCWSKSSRHIIFDVCMTLERKDRWVKDGHRTPETNHSTYAGVVSRESIRIALTYAALNNLDVCACDILNAYIQRPISEKHFVICGPEFGLKNFGCQSLIIRTLYGGNSAGADYWRHVRSDMVEIDFNFCTTDHDV